MGIIMHVIAVVIRKHTYTRVKVVTDQRHTHRTSSPYVLFEQCTRLDQISHVHWHLFDGGIIEGLNLTHRTNIVVRHEVDGDTFTTEATRTADTVDVVLAVPGRS